VYPLYVQKVERKGRSRVDVDQAIAWLTGYDAAGLQAQIDHEVDMATFFAEAPAINPASLSMTGTVCGVRLEAIEDPLVRQVRCMDKLVDELAKGKALEKILR
jgi:hypothetical protein